MKPCLSAGDKKEIYRRYVKNRAVANCRTVGEAHDFVLREYPVRDGEPRWKLAAEFNVLTEFMRRVRDEGENAAVPAREPFPDDLIWFSDLGLVT